MRIFWIGNCIIKEIKIFWQFIDLVRILQLKRFTILITFMCYKEFHYSFVSQISFAQSIVVKTVYLWVSQDSSNSLQVDNQQISTGCLPTIVAEGLRYKGAFIDVRVAPTCIVIILFVLAFYQIFCIIIFIW